MTARPTATPSAMVEKVHELLRDHFRDPGDYESNDLPGVGDVLQRVDHRVALSIIAAVLDNLPVAGHPPHEYCCLRAAIAAARATVTSAVESLSTPNKGG